MHVDLYSLSNPSTFLSASPPFGITNIRKKESMSRCAASASFSSRSGRFGREQYPQGPDPGQYASAFQSDTIAATARQSMSKNPSAGAFGGRAARDMPWSEKNAQREGGVNEAPVPSTFATPRGAPPSSAFAGQSKRFSSVPGATVTPGPGEYKAAPSPLQSSNRVNRSASFGSRSKRFVGIKMEDTPAPGSFAPKAGAFDSASQKRRSSFGAFGGRSTRESPFAAGGAQNSAPAPGAYDASAYGGAFTERSSKSSSKSSAAFASRSSRFGRDWAAQASAGVPDPAVYNPDAHWGMAKEASKTFNKMSSRGGAGFGTSARRPETEQFAAREGPAPGSYVHDERFGQASDRRAAARPSSAFASRTKGHEGYLRASDAPASTDYDAHAQTGMAAQAAKSFNRLARSGSFGSRAKRQLGERTHETPGPGSYANAKDPLRPSCESTATSARGSRSSAFASTSQARPSPTTWAAPQLR